MASVIEHVPTRPGWDCGACGAPWPCAPAKVNFFEFYNGDARGLSVHLGRLVHDALEEAIHGNDWSKVDDLYERFVGWIKPGALSLAYRSPRPDGDSDGEINNAPAARQSVDFDPEQGCTAQEAFKAAIGQNADEQIR